MYRKFGKRILGIILSGCGNEMQVEATKLIDQMQKYVDEKLEELNECKRDAELPGELKYIYQVLKIYNGTSATKTLPWKF